MPISNLDASHSLLSDEIIGKPVPATLKRIEAHNAPLSRAGAIYLEEAGIEHVWSIDRGPLGFIDPSKIQVFPGTVGNFRYEVYFPPEARYECCIAQTQQGESITSPMAILPLNASTRFVIQHSWAIWGSVGGLKSDRSRKVFYLFGDYSGDSYSSRADAYIDYRPTGKYQVICPMPTDREAASYSVDEEIILYREIWTDSTDKRESEYTLHDKGPGIVVWLRPVKE